MRTIQEQQTAAIKNQFIVTIHNFYEWQKMSDKMMLFKNFASYPVVRLARKFPHLNLEVPPDILAHFEEHNKNVSF
jgi:hypothetical protein